ncbi:MAG: crossover junction endodeoxyribonuclease RuvC [Candidatus Omnitrophota bacterium]
MRENIILGIDPGINVTGYGVLRLRLPLGGITLLEAGVIRTNDRQIISRRINKIFQTVHTLIKDTRPNVLIIEDLYSHYKHPLTAIKMAHARGVVLLAAQLQHVKIVTFSAKRIKKAVTGNGNASKEQVKNTVKQLLNIKRYTGPLDVTDALALCLGYIHIARVKIKE